MVAATSNPWPITPLTDKDLNFAVVNYDFASFTDSEQSELPSLEGALDVSLLDYAASIADQATIIASLFTGLDDVFAVLDEIGNDDLESIFTPLANAAGQGDAILVQYNGLIGDNSGGGSGGGSNTLPIQTATGPVLTCQASESFDAQTCGGYPCSSVVPYTNQSGKDQTIESITLVQASGGPWTVTTDAQASFPNGATVHLTITATRQPQLTETAQVQIKIRGFGNPNVLCMNAVPSSAGTSGSGTGGGLKLFPAPQ